MKRNKSFVDNKPILHLIACPIGNLKEFAPRAIEEIKNVDIVACEDTRNTTKLLAFFNIVKPLISLREHNELSSSDKLLEQIKLGKKVCYLSDAGYPGISDPGYILVKKCIENDINISVINGSSAFLSGLIPSGLDTSHFYFYGFLSAKDVEAKKELEQLKNIKNTIIFYEAPHRINKTLKLMLEVLKDRKAVIARELTKINEEFIRGTLKELSLIDPSTLRGEMVIILEGQKETTEINNDEIINDINLLIQKGLSKKDAVEIYSKIKNINKNIINKLVIKN